jgi:transketolase
VATLGIDSFGESAPLGDLLQHFGLTPQRLAERVRSVLAGR